MYETDTDVLSRYDDDQWQELLSSLISAPVPRRLFFVFRNGIVSNTNNAQQHRKILSIKKTLKFDGSERKNQTQSVDQLYFTDDTEARREAILNAITAGDKLYIIAQEYGVSLSLVSRIKSGTR